MKGIENMFASMIGIDPIELQNMMKGFVDNAAYLAENVDVIKADIAAIVETQKAICEKLGIERVEPKLPVERITTDAN